METWIMNLYSNPSNYGLELIADVNFSEGWDFDIYALFRNDDGMYFMAHDSGCSCPSPFEDYHSASDIADGRVFNTADVMEYFMANGASGQSFVTIHEFMKTAQVAGLSGDNVVPPS